MTPSQHSVSSWCGTNDCPTVLPEQMCDVCRLVEQKESSDQYARDMEKAANAMSADVTRFGKALQEILDLDPRLTHDGYDRDDDSRYEDEVYAIAEAAMRGVPYPAISPEASERGVTKDALGSVQPVDEPQSGGKSPRSEASAPASTPHSTGTPQESSDVEKGMLGYIEDKQMRASP